MAIWSVGRVDAASGSTAGNRILPITGTVGEKGAPQPILPTLPQTSAYLSTENLSFLPHIHLCQVVRLSSSWFSNVHIP